MFRLVTSSVLTLCTALLSPVLRTKKDIALREKIIEITRRVQPGQYAVEGRPFSLSYPPDHEAALVIEFKSERFRCYIDDYKAQLALSRNRVAMHQDYFDEDIGRVVIYLSIHFSDNGRPTFVHFRHQIERYDKKFERVESEEHHELVGPVDELT